MNRPNIVWICVDDFTPDVCGAYGNQQVHTPNLDRLASQGSRFDRAYCSCPLSTPSRQAFFTGRYPRRIGVTLSRTPLPKNEVTLPVLLKRVGYQTAAFGKTHYYFPRKYEYDTCVDLGEYHAWLNQKGRQPIPPEIDVLGHFLNTVCHRKMLTFYKGLTRRVETKSTISTNNRQLNYDRSRICLYSRP